MASTLYHQEGI